jgi:hypothetical protein
MVVTMAGLKAVLTALMRVAQMAAMKADEWVDWMAG